MTTITVHINEGQDGRITLRVLGPTADKPETEQETRAANMLYGFIRALARYMARDFAGRFSERPTKE